MNQLNRNRDSGLRDKLLMVVIAVGAAGAGVTGTLLWMESQGTPPPAAAPATTTQAAPSMGMPGSSVVVPPTTTNGVTAPVHEPPAELTMNLSPPQASLKLGNWFYDHEQWPRAITEYQKAITGGFDNPNIRTDLGNCYRFTNEPQKALEQYRRAQKQDPQHEQSLFNQGGLYASSLNNRKKAVEIWREYLKKFPKGQTVTEAKQLIEDASGQR